MYVIKRKAINFSTCTFRKAQTFALVRTCVCMCVCFKSVRASKEHQLNYVQYVCVCERMWGGYILIKFWTNFSYLEPLQEYLFLWFFFFPATCNENVLKQSQENDLHALHGVCVGVRILWLSFLPVGVCVRMSVLIDWLIKTFI